MLHYCRTYLTNEVKRTFALISHISFSIFKMIKNNVQNHDLKFPIFSLGNNLIEYSRIGYSRIQYGRIEYGRIEYSRIEYGRIEYGRTNMS